MSTVIYRKYRPSSFNEVIGQDHVTSILREAIMQDRIAHAYLFSGPRGTGKTSVARLMAQAVNCENFTKNKDVCNECEACIEINSGTSLDIIEMDAASNRGIEEIRSLKDSVNFMPSSLKRKVYIIDEAHMLTKDAFNALLKTLEEPPEHVVFILATTEPHKLPITILSRVQRHDFRLVDRSQLMSKLAKIFAEESKDVEDSVYDLLYTQSHGSFRDAESLVGKLLSTISKQSISKQDVYHALGLINEETVDLFVSLLLQDNRVEALKILETFSGDSVNTSIFIDQLLEKLRLQLIDSIGDSRQIISIIKAFVSAKQDMKVVHDKILPLQVAVCEVTAQPEVGESQISNYKSQKEVAQKKQKTKTSSVEPPASSADRQDFVAKKNDEKKKDQPEQKQDEEKTANQSSASTVHGKKVKDVSVAQVLQFIQNSDLPMLMRNQLRGAVITINGDTLEVACDPDVQNYLAKDERKEQLLNLLKREFGFTAINFGESVLHADDEPVVTNSYDAVDNSDIVEELL